jgi:hypothetical protein
MFTEYDEQIDSALGITPPAAKKLKTMSERKQKKMNHTNFRSLRLRGQSPANFMLDESSMSSISSTDTDATSVYDDGLFIQLPASPKTETLMAENLNDLSNFGL